MHVIKKIALPALAAIGIATAIPQSAFAMTYAQCLSTLMRDGYASHGNTPLGIRIKAAFIVCDQFWY